MAANKEQQALERLAPKLSALRKTLRGEERKLLDRMVLSISSEVQPHSVKVQQKDMTKNTKAQDRMIKAATPQHEARLTGPTPEVSLHSANVRQKNTTKTDSANARWTDSKTTQAEGRWNLRI